MKAKLLFIEIDTKMVEQFHKYMQNELNLEGVSCKKYMEAFKKVVRFAAKENYLDPTNIELLFDDIVSVPYFGTVSD